MYNLKGLKEFNILNPYAIIISLGIIAGLKLSFVLSILFFIVFFKFLNKIKVPKDKNMLIILFLVLLVVSGNIIYGISIYSFVLILINSDVIYTRDKEYLGLNTFSDKVKRIVKVTINRGILSLTFIPYSIYFIAQFNIVLNLNILISIFTPIFIIVYVMFF